MAELILDISVKGYDETDKKIEKLAEAGDKLEKRFKRISASSSFTSLIGKDVGRLSELTSKVVKHADKLANNFRNANLATRDNIEGIKILNAQEQLINKLFIQRAKLQADLIAKQGTADPTANRLGREADAINKDIALIKKSIDAEKLKAIETKKRLTEQSNYWGRYYIEKARLQKADTARTKAALQKQSNYWTAHYKKQQADQKKLAQSRAKFMGSLSSSIGIGFAAGGAAGIAVGAVTLLANAITSLIGLFARLTTSAAQSFYTINKNAEQTRILLSTALGGTDLGESMFQDILNMADKMPFSVDSISASFVKLQTAGIDKAAEKVTILADAISAFGGTDEDLKLATIAIQQMAGKGVVSMEEMRRQLGERVPTALRGMAREMEMTYLELVDKISTGTLLFDDKAQEALFAGLQDNAGAAEKRMDSMYGAVIALQNAWSRLILDIGEGNGSFKALTGVVKSITTGLTNFRKSVEGQAIIAKFSEKLAEIFKQLEDPQAVVAAITRIAAVFDKLGSAIQYGIQGFGTLLKWWDRYTNALEKGWELRDKILGGLGNLIPEDVLQSIKEAILPNWDAIGSWFDDPVDVVVETNIDKSSYDKTIDKLEELQSKRPSVNVDIEDAKAKLKSLTNEYDKLTETLAGLSDKKFNLELEMATDKEANRKILDEVAYLKEEAAKFGEAGGAGLLKQIEYLEKAKELMGQMRTEGVEVTKQDVARAKQVYEGILQKTGGGRRATGDVAEDLKKARMEYEKLSKLRASDKKLVEDDAVNKQKQGIKEVNELMLKAIENAEAQKDKLAEQITVQEELAGVTSKYQEQWMIDMVKGNKEIDNRKAKIIDLTDHIRKMGEESAIAQRKLSEVRSTSTTDEKGVDYNIETGRAIGGPVYKNRTYPVGEKGVELFTPNQNGRITPNNQLNKGGVEEVNVNFNIGGKKFSLRGNRSEVAAMNTTLKEQQRYGT